MSFEQEKVNAHKDLIARVAGVRDDLRELRRYVRTKPNHLMTALASDKGAIDHLNELSRLLPAAHATVPARIIENLLVALAWTRACPAAMEGYLDGADWELALIVSRLEKEDPR